MAGYLFIFPAFELSLRRHRESYKCIFTMLACLSEFSQCRCARCYIVFFQGERASREMLCIKCVQERNISYFISARPTRPGGARACKSRVSRKKRPFIERVFFLSLRTFEHCFLDGKALIWAFYFVCFWPCSTYYLD